MSLNTYTNWLIVDQGIALLLLRSNTFCRRAEWSAGQCRFLSKVSSLALSLLPDVSQIGLSETVLSSLYPRKETRIAESTKGTAVPYNLS